MTRSAGLADSAGPGRPGARRRTSFDTMARERDQPIVDVITRERARLWHFIRRRVADPRDAEDILQDVFASLVEANRLLMPVEHVTGWLFRVARNRITDVFRKARPENFSDVESPGEGDERMAFEDLLPSPESGPDAEFARRVLLEQLELAIDELPEDQRDVFVAHEIEGRSFKELVAETGERLNTLLSRKRYAVLRLRERLKQIHDEYGKR
jgi:RNA polymerase sigma factor (sigma-70 family)